MHPQADQEEEQEDQWEKLEDQEGTERVDHGRKEDHWVESEDQEGRVHEEMEQMDQWCQEVDHVEDHVEDHSEEAPILRQAQFTLVFL